MKNVFTDEGDTRAGLKMRNETWEWDTGFRRW